MFKTNNYRQDFWFNALESNSDLQLTNEIVAYMTSSLTVLKIKHHHVLNKCKLQI